MSTTFDAGAFGSGLVIHPFDGAEGIADELSGCFKQMEIVPSSVY